MVLFREHRGSLTDSLGTVTAVHDLADLARLMGNRLKPFGVVVTPEKLKVKWYCFDERTLWNTWLVTLDGYGVLGMTDGPLGS